MHNTGVRETLLPGRIDSEAQLEEVLAQPTSADVACARRLSGDILILGAGGKMGPSLARRVHRAKQLAGSGHRTIAVSRFASTAARAALEADGIETIACDLIDPAQMEALPRAPFVLFLAGRKFGTTDRTDLTWATNTILPARVADHLATSSMVVFSTGNVYAFVPAASPAPTEAAAPAPVGEYAQSCLGRERVIEYVSRERGLRAVIFRLNYAVDLRYGTLVDIARRVFERQPIDLSVPAFNAIWQGDANSYAFRSLELCTSPPLILNVTGAERIAVRETAEWFGRAFGLAPQFVGTEGATALLSDSSKCRALLGEPAVSLEVLREWVAHWTGTGGATLGKPTHFEVADGQF